MAQILLPTTAWLLKEKVRFINTETGWTRVGEISRDAQTINVAVIMDGGFGTISYRRTGEEDADGYPILRPAEEDC